MPTVVTNIHQEGYDVYIGRRNMWGNPYRIGPDGDREEVIAKYEHWLRYHIQQGTIKQHHLKQLSGKRLGCHCSPLPCHGDVLVTVLREHGL